jgi:IS1 family transposase
VKKHKWYITRSVQAVDTDAIAADELWSFVEKNIHRCLPDELVAGDCWIALSLAQLSGLILTGRVGKHTDQLAIELVTSTEGKTNCKESHTDGWNGYERVLSEQIDHYISKVLTQRLERTNGIVRQQTGRTASPTKQIWQGMGADRGHCEARLELLQLDLAAFVPGNYSRWASRAS